MMSIEEINLRRNQHLLWRAGFGPNLQDLKHLEKVNHKSLVNKLFEDSAQQPPFIDVASEETVTFYKSTPGTQKAAAAMQANTDSTSDKNAVDMPIQRSAGEMDRRRIAQVSRDDIKTLNITWLNQMVDSKQQLREKMSLFWHGHFAANSGNILHQQKLLDVIRVNALGNFRTLLHEVSKSATMLNYLNNNQNRKNKPNENFAREVMELFTLGRGNYTEKDVKEAARAFTGWGANGSGEFILRPKQHDDTIKTFLGQTGNFGGEDILNILLEQKQTAKFITTKFYRYYVNDEPSPTHVTWLSDRFYASGYNISGLLKDIFSSDWFYDAQNIGSRIKSPVELLVGIRRTFAPGLKNPSVQLLLQRLLGQLLFYPPNVAGWPGGDNWIDSSSLMLRLQIPKLILEQEMVVLSPKDNDDQMMGMKDPLIDRTKQKAKSARGFEAIDATINWPDFISVFEKITRDQLANKVTQTLLIPTAEGNNLQRALMPDERSREAFIKSIAIQLMCMPEYQLC
jgi:uncharacterized protein (DUF1800 family)